MKKVQVFGPGCASCEGLAADVKAIVAEEDRGDWTYLRLDGRSGGVVELATTDDFDSLEDYGLDLSSRYLEFTKDPLAVEPEALRDVPVLGTVLGGRHHPVR